MSYKLIGFIAAGLSILASGCIWFLFIFYPPKIMAGSPLSLYTIAFFSSMTVSLLFAITGLINVGNQKSRIAEKKLLVATEQAEENLRQSIITLKEALQDLPISIFLCDRELRIEWLNDCALKILGQLDLEKVKQITLGTDIKILGGDGLPVNLHALDENFLKQEVSLTNSNNISHKALLAKKTFVAGSTEFFLFSLLDMSKNKELQVELTHAKKMETVGQLTAGIANELNTPSQYVEPNLYFILDAVQDMFHLLEEYDLIIEKLLFDYKPANSILETKLSKVRNDSNYEYLRKELPQAIGETKQGIKRITQIVRTLNKSSQSFTHRGVQSVDIHSIFQVIFEIFGSKWKNIADFKVDFAPGFCFVECVMSELTKAFQHLIKNSLQSLENQKKQSRSLSKGSIEIATRMEGDYVEIQIRDNGLGIPPDIQKRILKSTFVDKKNDQEFLNGLSYVYNLICTKLGGALTFTTEQNVGTTFTITLPVVNQEAAEDNDRKVVGNTSDITKKIETSEQ